MSRIFFACSGKSKNFVSTVCTDSINLVYAELAACECACFIKYECVCFCKSLNVDVYKRQVSARMLRVLQAATIQRVRLLAIIRICLLYTSVGTQAVFNVITGKRYSMCTNEFKGLVAGEYGTCLLYTSRCV